MRKRILGIFLMFCMALTLLPVMSLPVLAEEGSLPSILIVEPSETDGIPSKIDVVAASYDDGSNTVACDLYLPGSAVVSQCFFSWPDGFKAVVDGEEYDSGLCPVPAVGETRTYTFTAGSDHIFIELCLRDNGLIPNRGDLFDELEPRLVLVVGGGV